MASLSYERHVFSHKHRIAKSGPVRFIVGPEKRECMMHTDLAASLSKPLDRLIRGSVHGSMKEALTGVVEWPSVDEGTFVRFCQFAYTGDYEPAHPQSDPEDTSSKERAPQREHPVATIQPYATMMKMLEGGQTPTKKVSKKTTDIWANLNDWSVGEDEEAIVEKVDPAWKVFTTSTYKALGHHVLPTSNSNPLQNYAEVFLSHARLYTLADCYDIKSLMTLSLQRLHQELVAFTLFPDRMTDIAELIRYSYENTVDKKGPDPLRLLLAAYSSCKVKELWKSPDFRAVLEGSGEFGKALIGQMVEGIRLPLFDAC